MANLAPSVLRQASRLASKSALSATSRRGLQAVSRAAATPTPARAACQRCYVTQSRSDHAQVQVDTAIRLDRAEIEKAEAALEARNGSTTHVSPMAGKPCPVVLCLVLSQAASRASELTSSDQMSSSRQSRWTRGSGPSTSTCRPQHQ